MGVCIKISRVGIYQNRRWVVGVYANLRYRYIRAVYATDFAA